MMTHSGISWPWLLMARPCIVVDPRMSSVKQRPVKVGSVALCCLNDVLHGLPLVPKNGVPRSGPVDDEWRTAQADRRRRSADGC